MSGHFEVEFEPGLDFAPRFNVAPSQPVMTVFVPAAGEQRAVALRRWGLIPSWAEDPRIGNRQINARVETVSQKPAFRQAFRQRRCLIPADGFYEWSGPARSKQPYHISLPDRALFGFAGLWERWRDPQRGDVESCALITAAANARLCGLHTRMPVIVDPANYAAWLDPTRRDPDDLLGLLDSRRCDELGFHPVSYRVNDVTCDDAACLEAVPTQPTLF